MARKFFEAGARQSGKTILMGEALDDALIDAINKEIGTGWSGRQLANARRLQCFEHADSPFWQQWFLDGKHILNVYTKVDGILIESPSQS